MFASKERTTDPYPWTIVSPDPDRYGERLASPDWTTFYDRSEELAYQPRRTEFDQHLLEINPVLSWLREIGDLGDTYGWAMSGLFAIADYLTFTMHENVPTEWGYSPAMGGADTDSPEHEALVELGHELAAMFWGDEKPMLAFLDHAGRVMDHLINLHKLNGTDY